MKKVNHFLLLTITLFLGTFSFVNAQTDSYAYAVFIAIDEYQGNIWKPLKTPVNDANAIAALLTTQYAFDETIKIYNKAASRRAILDTLESIAANLSEHDQLLIFFSGHSMSISDEGYWIPSNLTNTGRTQMISNTEIKNIIAKSPSKHILLIADAILSNSVFKESQNYYKNNGSKNYYLINKNMNARQAITSNNKKPIANTDGQHSVFAQYLLKFLVQNETPLFSTSELFDLIKVPIEANSPNPPTFGHLQDANHEGGQFIFPLYIVEEPVEIPIVDCGNLNVEIGEGKKVTFEDENRILHAICTKKNVNYQWFAGLEALTINSPNLKVTKPGEYTIVVTDEFNCSKAATIEVNIIFKDAFVIVQEGSEVEFTQKGMLHARTNVEGLAIEWRHNNFIVGDKISLEVTQSGTYTVSIKGLDGSLIASASAQVTVNSETYTVKVGDNVERLARKFYNDESKKDLIINANPSIANNQGTLKVGSEIVIPSLNKEDGKSNVVKIGGVSDLIPFSAPGIYQNGIITNISQQVFKEMGVETSIKFMPLDKIKSGAYNGRFTVAQPLAKTPTGESFFKYSEPLYKILNVLFVKADSDLEYEKDKNLKGKRVAVTKGVSIVELDALVEKKIIKIAPALTLEIAFQMLERGEVDMVAAPQLVGLLTLKNMTSLNPDDFKMLPKELGTEDLFLVISKNHPDGDTIIADFNKTFLRLKNDGKIDEIVNLHLDKYQNP